jgi:hypothetical protein
MMSTLIDGFDRCVFSMLLIMLWFGCMLEQNDYILLDIYVYIQCIFDYTLCFYILYFISSVSILVQAVELSVVIVVICVVWSMASICSMKRTMGAEPDDAPIARRSWSLLGVGGANSMQPLLPAGGDYWYTMQCFGDLLGDPMMDQLLQPGILKNVRQEFDKHRPMLDVLDCHGRNSTTMKKVPAHVEYAAGVVYDWLSEEGGSVLGFLQVLSIGGLPYSDEFSDNVHRCAIGIKAMTMTKVAYQSAMVARLCLAGSVVGSSLVLEDCAPTQIDYEDDGKIDYEDDESSDHPEDIHNFHVDLFYAQTNDDYSDEFARTSVVGVVV